MRNNILAATSSGPNGRRIDISNISRNTIMMETLKFTIVSNTTFISAIRKLCLEI
jgi:hypothetical protein